MALTKTRIKRRTKTKITKTKPTTKSLLNNITRKNVTKTKSVIPQIQINDSEMLESMAKIIVAKMENTKIKSILEIEEAQLRDKASQIFEETCRKDSSLHTSVRFTGQHENENVSLQFTQKRQCLKMKEDAVDTLCSIFGEDYNDLFGAKKTIEINVEKLTEEQLEDIIEGMMKSIDLDTFHNAVSVESFVVPKDAFFTKRVLDPKIRIKARNASDEGVAKVFKASFKA